MPKEIHQQLKDISEATGIPMSTMMLQATIEKYLEGDRKNK
jgi:predicted DNA-binding protein